VLYFAASKVIWPSCDFQMRLRMLYKYIVLFDRVVTAGFDDPTMSIYSTPKYTYENHLCPHSLNWYWCIGLMLATTLWTDTHVSVATWQVVSYHLCPHSLNWYSCISFDLASGQLSSLPPLSELILMYQLLLGRRSEFTLALESGGQLSISLMTIWTDTHVSVWCLLTYQLVLMYELSLGRLSVIKWPSESAHALSTITLWLSEISLCAFTQDLQSDDFPEPLYHPLCHLTTKGLRLSALKVWSKASLLQFRPRS